MNLWTPEISSTNYYERGKFTLAWRLALVSSILFILLTINFSGSVGHFITYLICLLFSFGALFGLHTTQKSRVVYIVITIFGTTIASFNLIYLTEIYQAGNILWKIFIITFTFFGLGKKWGAIIFVLNLFSLIYYSIATVNVNLENIIPLTLFGRVSLAIEFTIVTFMIAYIIYEFLNIQQLSYTKILHSNEELVKQNTIIQNQSEEKTTLVKEIHHRVKNNLQIIVSLLRLQKGELKSEDTKIQFSQAINRVMVMSLIHRRLYQENELSKIKIQSYIKELAEDIKSLTDTGLITKIFVTSEIEMIGLKTIVPLGLIINELISNSIKHAFTESEKREIHINIQRKSKEEFILTYNDNGRWKIPEENASSFGVDLIGILAEQMDGDLKRTNDEKGTEYRFLLKNIDLEK